MTRKERWWSPLASVSGTVGRVFGLRRVLVAAPLVFLPPVAASDEDSMLVAASTGEVETSAAARAATRLAAERFVVWESRTIERTTVAPGRGEVAEGIRLLADAVQATGDAALGSALSEVLVAMRWHGEQLTERPVRASLGDYEDAGHAHAAFMHAARLLGAMPDAPDWVTGELARAASAVDARPLPAQGAEVRAFFRRASAALAP